MSFSSQLPLSIRLPLTYTKTNFVQDKLKQRAQERPLREGDGVPYVKFSRYNKGGAVVETDTHEIFKEGFHFLVSVPGAFTPTCDEKHLPALIKVAQAFQKYGVKMHIMSVDNRDVMRGWLKSQQGGDCMDPIPDWNWEMTLGMRIGIDKCEPRNLGLVARRGAYLIYGERGQAPKFVKVSMEVKDTGEDDSGNCTGKTNGEQFLAVIPELLKKYFPSLKPQETVYAEGKEGKEDDPIWV